MKNVLSSWTKGQQAQRRAAADRSLHKRRKGIQCKESYFPLKSVIVLVQKKSDENDRHDLQHDIMSIALSRLDQL